MKLHKIVLFLMSYIIWFSFANGQETKSLDKRLFNKDFKLSPLAEELLEIYKGVPTKSRVGIKYPRDVLQEHVVEKYQNAWEEILILHVNIQPGHH